MSLKFTMGPSLYENLLEWWQTVDHCQSGPVLSWQLARRVEEWLPSEQTYCGSQLPAEVEIEIDGYNKALLEIKSKIVPPNQKYEPTE